MKKGESIKDEYPDVHNDEYAAQVKRMMLMKK